MLADLGEALAWVGLPRGRPYPDRPEGAVNPYRGEAILVAREKIGYQTKQALFARDRCPCPRGCLKSCDRREGEMRSRSSGDGKAATVPSDFIWYTSPSSRIISPTICLNVPSPWFAVGQER